MVWQSLGVLQEGLSHSPSNAQFKLLLLLLYCRLGAFEPVVDLYSSLDAKHVQHDTIGSVHEHGYFNYTPESCLRRRTWAEKRKLSPVLTLHVLFLF